MPLGHTGHCSMWFLFYFRQLGEGGGQWRKRNMSVSVATRRIQSKKSKGPGSERNITMVTHLGHAHKQWGTCRCAAPRESISM